MGQTKEKKYIVGSILCGLLTIFGVVATAFYLLSETHGIWFVSDCARLVLFILVFLYAFIGYRKPHGNMLKYIILIYAALLLLHIYALAQVGNTGGIILRAIEIGLLCHIAGRLVKARENCFLMVVTTICIVAELVVDGLAGLITMGVAGPLVTWLDICVAYFLRYKQHREAGLEDAPKSK